MADVDLKRVDPIFSDLDPDLRTDNEGNLIVLENAAAIDGSVENILGIEPGELLMNPNFGASLNEVVGRNVTEATSSFIRMTVSRSLEQDPRILVKSVAVTPYPDQAEYRLLVQYQANNVYIRGLFERLVSAEG
jgi:phage baseplate assembly protein W